jgi:putative colanic acid biosynthesis glycosyltransferase WcaI
MRRVGCAEGATDGDLFHVVAPGGRRCMSMPVSEPVSGTELSDLSVVHDAPPTLVVRPRNPVPTPAAPAPVAHPLTGKRALVVGINYAPEPTGIAPYTTGMANHLAQYADDVTVLTGVPHYPHWSLAPEDRRMFRSRSSPGAGHPTIRRLRHYVPAKQTALTRGWYEASFCLNALSWRPTHRPDVVIAVTPSLGGAVAGAQLASRYGARLIVVVQDLMAKAASQSGISGGGRAANATASIERYALTRADRVAVVSEAFREQVHEYGVRSSRITVLPNWTHISPSPIDQRTARQQLGWPLDEFTVVHTGNIGLKQDLGNMVEAARLCRDVAGLRFVIVGEGNQRSAVEALGADLPNLTFVPPLSSDLYPASLAAADVLVVNERPGVGDMSLPSKLTSYLSAGRPVLAAVHSEGATARELRRTGGAARVVTPGDAGAFASAVTDFRRDEVLRLNMGAAGAAFAREHLSLHAAKTRLDELISVCLTEGVPV